MVDVLGVFDGAGRAFTIFLVYFVITIFISYEKTKFSDVFVFFYLIIVYGVLGLFVKGSCFLGYDRKERRLCRTIDILILYFKCRGDVRVKRG